MSDEIYILAGDRTLVRNAPPLVRKNQIFSENQPNAHSDGSFTIFNTKSAHKRHSALLTSWDACSTSPGIRLLNHWVSAWIFVVAKPTQIPPDGLHQLSTQPQRTKSTLPYTSFKMPTSWISSHGGTWFRCHVCLCRSAQISFFRCTSDQWCANVQAHHASHRLYNM